MRKNMRGLSLIEVVITVGIFSLLSIIVVGIMIGFNDSFRRQSGRIETQRSAARVAQILRDTALQADSLTASRTISGTTYTTGSTTAVFVIPALASSGYAIEDVYDHVVIHATGTLVQHITELGAGSTRRAGVRTIGRLVQNLTLIYDSADPAQVRRIDASVRTETTMRTEVVSSSLQKILYLRNQ
jgi:Tfp pilus assembly protein PilW